MEVETSGKYIDKTAWGIWQLILDATYRFNKTIATATIRFIVTVAIVVYKGSKLVVYRMLTQNAYSQKGTDRRGYRKYVVYNIA